MSYAKILATGSYLPEKILTNKDLEKIVETDDEWIVSRVGIKERHIAGPDDTTVSMAIEAAKRAVEAADIDVNDIELILVGTATSNMMFPSVASYVQNALGMTNEAAAFDINAACSGFLYCLSVAEKYILSAATHKKILVIGVDCLSKITDWSDRSTCILFGDGAGAVVIAASDEPGILGTKIHADGKYHDYLKCRHPVWSDQPEKVFLEMRGNEVFKVAVRKLDEIVVQILEQAGLEKKDIDWLIPHQANLRIIQATAKRLDLPMDKVILTVQDHGNTSAASVPLALDSAVRSGKIQRGDIVLLEAFGASFTWGATILKY